MYLRKRTLALFMSIIMAIMLLPFRVFASANTSVSSNTVASDEQVSSKNDAPVSGTDSNFQDSAGNVTRDIALVLDNSVSMEGTPLVNLKEAAIKFCTSVLDADGINRVAIVTYDSDISTTTDFINDLDILSDSINSMDSQGSWTNITAGVQKADELLQRSTAGIKSILVMTDGVPTAGPYSSSGPYSYGDYSSTHNASHYVFEYANSLYENMIPLLDKYNVYTLGFFHNTSESTKNFASRILNDIQNSGYYEVTDPNDLEFTFGTVANDITQDQLKKLYTDQHVEYYNGNYKKEIKKIGLPDEKGDNRRNTNNLLGNIVLDAAEDNVSTSYNAASIIADSLNLNFDFVDGAIANYELILADIVTSSYYKDVLEEVCFASLKDDTVLLLKDCLDFGFNKIDEMAKKANVSVNDLRQEWQTLAQTLDQMKVCDDPGEFATLFGKCSIVVDKYVKTDEKNNFLNSINGKKGYKGNILNATLGAAVDTASEIITYYSCYDAYCTASDTFQEILSLIGYYANSVVQTGTDGNPIYIGGPDEIYYSISLSAAVTNFLDNTGDEATSAQQIAEKFAKEGIDNLGSSFAQAGVDFLLGKIPIVGAVNNARKIVGLTAAGAMFIVDCSTKLDNRAYTASMIYHLYFLANYATVVADDCGEILVNEEDSEKAFKWACRFDEAIRIWRCCTIMICDLGMDFESYCLQSAQKYMNSLTSITMEKASWYSTAISIAALEKELTSNIHCHNVNLSYDPSSGVINWSQNAQIITIACPVSVCVADENGKQIAFLSDDFQTIERGYEPYFHILETEHGSNDYMKICYIPNNWKITFTGTGNGIMHVLKGDIIGGKIHNSVKSPEITITEETEGYIAHDDENIVVINSSETYTITFNANGGKLISDSTMSTDNNGRLSSLPADPTHDSNYTFKGWYTEATGGTLITTNYAFNTDTIVYAQWMNTGFSENESGSSEDPSNIIGNNNSSSSGDNGNSNIAGNNDITEPVISDSSDDSIITPDKSVDTGDTANIPILIILLLIAFTGIITIIFLKNKRPS